MPPQSPTPRKIETIVSNRKRLVAELTQLRKLRGPSARAVATAQTLLTRAWARATWRSRERLIRAAEWLVRLEQHRDA